MIMITEDYTGVYLVIMLLTLKDTVIPSPSQTSSDYQCTTGHCNISSDVTFFDINCSEII